MATKEEETNRLKLKLKLYGSYTTEMEQKEHRYFEIEQELSMNNDIRKAANNMGCFGDGPYHPPEAELKIEYSSLKQEIEELKEERSYLGLDDFLQSLPPIDFKIIMSVYCKRMTHQETALDSNMSRRTVQRKLNEIYESWRSSPHGLGV